VRVGRFGFSVAPADRHHPRRRLLRPGRAEAVVDGPAVTGIPALVRRRARNAGAEVHPSDRRGSNVGAGLGAGIGAGVARRRRNAHVSRRTLHAVAEAEALAGAAMQSRRAAHAEAVPSSVAPISWRRGAPPDGRGSSTPRRARWARRWPRRRARRGGRSPPGPRPRRSRVRTCSRCRSPLASSAW
jgi:hypothetical protein